MRHDKYKHWTQAGTLSTLSKFQIDELRKNHSVEIYHRRVMIRKKPSKQLTLVQPHKRLETMGDFAPKVKQEKHKTFWYRFHKWLRKVLLVIITFELVIGYATFNAKQLIGVEAKIDISPVTFTDDEIKELIKANPNAVIEPKYQHLAAEVKKEVKETSVEGLIRKHFGESAEFAICIAKMESGLNPLRENISIARGNYKGECSIGVFQVNLKSNACLGSNVHYNRVDGDTIEAKKDSLRNAEYNIKYASQLYKSWGNWSPWINSYRKCIQ